MRTEGGGGGVRATPIALQVGRTATTGMRGGLQDGRAAAAPGKPSLAGSPSRPRAASPPPGRRHPAAAPAAPAAAAADTAGPAALRTPLVLQLPSGGGSDWARAPAHRRTERTGKGGRGGGGTDRLRQSPVASRFAPEDLLVVWRAPWPCPCGVSQPMTGSCEAVDDCVSPHHPGMHDGAVAIAGAKGGPAQPRSPCTTKKKRKAPWECLAAAPWRAHGRRYGKKRMVYPRRGSPLLVRIQAWAHRGWHTPARPRSPLRSHTAPPPPRRAASPVHRQPSAQQPVVRRGQRPPAGGNVSGQGGQPV